MDYAYAGDIELVELSLISFSGQVIDISHVALEINVYQSLFKHFLRCEIAVADSLNLGNILKGNPKENIPGGWTGGETIMLAYREKTDPSKDSEVPIKRHMFLVYKSSDRIKNNDFTEQYMLQCVSLEAFITLPQKIRKSFGGKNGNTISNMVKGICEKYLYSKPISDMYSKVNIKKENEIDETSGLRKFVIPTLTVDETINFLANEADSDQHYPFYLFYEDSIGFKFRNIPKILRDVSQQETELPTYFYFMSNYFESTDKEDVKYDDQYKIIDFEVTQTNNILEDVMFGLYKAKNIELDIVNKKAKTTVFDYQKEKENFETLQSGNFPGNVGSEDVMISLSTKGNIKDKRNSYKKQIFNNIMKLSIPGNTSLNVGNVINLNFYINNSIIEDRGLDKQLSGRYIITELRQKINQNIFTTILTVAKDVSLI